MFGKPLILLLSMRATAGRAAEKDVFIRVVGFDRKFIITINYQLLLSSWKSGTFKIIHLSP